MKIYILSEDLEKLKLGQSVKAYPVAQRDDAGFGDLYPQWVVDSCHFTEVTEKSEQGK